jgi:hypothetical protein
MASNPNPAGFRMRQSVAHEPGGLGRRGTSVARRDRMAVIAMTVRRRTLAVLTLTLAGAGLGFGACRSLPSGDPKPEPNTPLPSLDRRSPEPGHSVPPIPLPRGDAG